LLQQVFLSAQQLDDWGWRIPFFIGAGFAVVAFYLRRRLAETEAFEARQKTAGNLFKLLLRHPRAIATVAGLTLGGTVAVNTFTVYMQKFLVNSGGLSKSASSLVTAGTLVFFMCLQPLVGALSDRIGRRPILITFGVLGTLMSVPLLTAISQTRSPWTATALILVGLVIVSGYTAVNAVTKAELTNATITSAHIVEAGAFTAPGATARRNAPDFKGLSAFSNAAAGCCFITAGPTRMSRLRTPSTITRRFCAWRARRKTRRACFWFRAWGIAAAAIARTYSTPWRRSNNGSNAVSRRNASSRHA
jgi:MHS family alpha-ketoglutarate permease-like MFS transporter